MDARLRNVNVGSGVTYTATFQDAVTGAAVDPTTVTFKIKAPDDTVTTYTYGTDAQLTKTRTGVYKVVFVHTAAGEWHSEFAGRGTDFNHTFTGLVIVDADAIP